MQHVTPLRGFQFKTYFETEPVVSRFYEGVYSLDEIPKELPIRHFVVVNLSKKDEEGTHWIVICRSDPSIYEIFNSLGFETLGNLVPEYFAVSSDTDIIYNGHSFQMENTSTCGYFCVYFAVHRVFNYDMSFHSFLESFFDECQAVNEERVIKFCQSLIDGTTHLFDEI